MVVKFFAEPVQVNGDWKTMNALHVFDTNQIIEYEYTKRWSRSGEFSLVLPFDRTLLGLMELGGILMARDNFSTDWLWVQKISHNPSRITLSGTDCKGFLESRVTMYDGAGADAYDTCNGTTAQCIKRLLDRNLIEPETSSRAMPLQWSGGADRLTDDRYMTRLEYVSDLVTTLCDGADIGYDVVGNLSGSLFNFVTLAGTDHSRSQSDNSRVIFSARHGNCSSVEFCRSSEQLRNAAYATGPNGYTGLAERGSGSSVQNMKRRECAVSVSVNSSDSWFTRYALQEISDNVTSFSFSLDVASGAGYGTDFTLGDKVTVFDDCLGNFYDERIREVTKRLSADEQSVSLVIGRADLKPFEQVVGELSSGVARRN